MDEKYIALAQQLVTYLAQNDFLRVEQHFDNEIRQQVPAAKLQTTWQTLEAQLGAFQRQVDTHVSQVNARDVVIVTCAFAKANLDVIVAFNDQDEVIGLNVVPSSFVDRQPSQSPPYVQTERFQEQELQVGQGEWALPGTLTLPNGTGPFPAVVLVHGSGPNDRDETIGPNKPFLDLAWGLASQGIAVLRYDKRTKVYGEKIQQSMMMTLTVQEETIDDAVVAVALLRTLPHIDPHNVFVLGHSLGAYLLPRIGEADKGITGLVMMAAMFRSLEDTLLDQITYIFSLQDTLSEAEQAYIETIKKQVAHVKEPDLSIDTPSAELPLGVPAAYWLDLRRYQPGEVAQRLTQPMFFLQAESDYQVTLVDYQGWESAMGSRSNVQFKSYAGLSHLFMPVEGGHMARPTTYAIPGHITAEVVTDIVQWIKAQVN